MSRQTTRAGATVTLTHAFARYGRDASLAGKRAITECRAPVGWTRACDSRVRSPGGHFSVADGEFCSLIVSCPLTTIINHVHQRRKDPSLAEERQRRRYRRGLQNSHHEGACFSLRAQRTARTDAFFWLIGKERWFQGHLTRGNPLGCVARRVREGQARPQAD